MPQTSPARIRSAPPIKPARTPLSGLKNNPAASGYRSDDLFYFPGHFRTADDGSVFYENNTVVMSKNTPYVELRLGVHNILKILHVENVRRLTYKDNPGTHKNGIRFMFRVFF